MKKLLSVLLSVLMIVGCLSVGFSAFAEAPEGAEELIKKINDAIGVAIQQEMDEDGGIAYLDGHTAGYGFGRNFQPMSVSVEGDTRNYFKTVINSHYPEYSGFMTTEVLTADDEGNALTTRQVPDFNAIGTYALAQYIDGVSGMPANNNDDALYNSFMEATSKDAMVKKDGDAESVFGEDALRFFDINPEYVASVDGDTLYFNDIDIAAGDSVAESVIPAIVNMYPDLSGASGDVIKKAESAGITMEDYTLKYTGITLSANFDGDRITGLDFSFNIEASATLKYNSKTMTMNASTGCSYGYYNIEYFEDGEFDYAELAKKINEATKYAVDSNAGYDFTRVSDKTDDQSIYLNLTPDAYDMLGGLEGQAKDTIFKYLDTFTVAIDNMTGLAGTGYDITGYKWVCNGENCPVCAVEGTCTEENNHANDPTTGWVCNGEACPVCQQHQDNATGNVIECRDHSWFESWVREEIPWLSDSEVAEKVAEMEANCTCGSVDLPKCTCGKQTVHTIPGLDVSLDDPEINIGEGEDATHISLNNLISQGVKKIVEKFNDLQTDSVTKVTDIGAESAVVPKDDINPKYALKATELTVDDFDQTYEPDFKDGMIYFYLPYLSDSETVIDENSPIAHLTDNYVSSADFKAATAEAVLGKIPQNDVIINGSELAYQGFDIDENPSTEDSGTPILVKVAFEEADDGNWYGNGKLKSLVIDYTTAYQYQFGIGAIQLQAVDAKFGSYMNSTYDNFQYGDYEKGDADLSGRVSIIDAKLVLKYVAGTEELNDVQRDVADMGTADTEYKVGMDGRISTLDAKRILQKIAQS